MCHTIPMYCNPNYYRFVYDFLITSVFLLLLFVSFGYYVAAALMINLMNWIIYHKRIQCVAEH